MTITSRKPKRVTTMRAIVQEQYCPVGWLETASIPTPKPTDTTVLVKVEAASANPFDRHVVTGKPYLVRSRTGWRAPAQKTPGVDVAGVVEAVGPDVTAFAVGDEVFGYAKGSYAEYTLASETSLVAKPLDVSFEAAAAVPLAGFTALQALRDSAGIGAGDHVLINGASGGVGTLAVQIAKALGATVTGVCSTRNVEMVHGLGADHVVDYTVDDFTALPRQFDAVLDNIGNRRVSAVRSVMKPAGIYVGIGMPKTGDWIKPITHSIKVVASFAFRPQKGAPFLAQENHADLVVLADMLAAGHITPHIGHRFSLGQTGQALELIASGHAQGKVIILP